MSKDWLFSVFNSKRKKQRNSIGLLANIKIVFWFKTQNVNTPQKMLFILTHYYWNNKHGTVKKYVSCASSGIY